MCVLLVGVCDISVYVYVSVCFYLASKARIKVIVVIGLGSPVSSGQVT